MNLCVSLIHRLHALQERISKNYDSPCGIQSFHIFYIDTHAIICKLQSCSPIVAKPQILIPNYNNK